MLKVEVLTSQGQPFPKDKKGKDAKKRKKRFAQGERSFSSASMETGPTRRRQTTNSSAGRRGLGLGTLERADNTGIASEELHDLWVRAGMKRLAIRHVNQKIEKPHNKRCGYYDKPIVPGELIKMTCRKPLAALFVTFQMGTMTGNAKATILFKEVKFYGRRPSTT